MSRIDLMIRNLRYESYTPVMRVFDEIIRMANEAKKRGDLRIIRRLIDKVLEWQASINTYHSYYSYRDQVANQGLAAPVSSLVLFNLSKASRNISSVSSMLQTILREKTTNA